MPRALAALVLSVALLAASDPASSAGTVTVAAVDAAGILVPIARFDGTRWLAGWPPTDEDRIPATLDAVPRTWPGADLPRRWTYWPSDGGSPLEIGLVEPVYAGACVGTVGFASTETAADKHFTGSWTGVAVDTTAPIGRPAAASAHDAGAAPLMRRLRERLAAALARESAKWPDRFSARGAPSGSAAETVELLARHEARSHTTWFARLTAVYPAVPTSSGPVPLGIRLTAWVREDAGGLRVIGAETESFSPDEDKARRRRPLGVVAIDGREFWVLEQLYYESVDFAIVEVSPAGVVDRVDEASGSGC